MQTMFKRKRSDRRWIPLVAGGAALAAGGVALAARRRPAPGPESFERFELRFRLSHEALRRNLSRFVELIDREEPIDTDAFGQFVKLYGEFLVAHHETEDRAIFPTLRRHGRLRTTDAAHLDRWTAEHRDVNVLGEALVRAGEQAGSGLMEIRRLAVELGELLRPHLASEEELFTAAHLAEMLPADAVPDLAREARKLVKDPAKMAIFYAHSLLPGEQLQVFGDAPWLFRKVVLPLVDRRAFPRFAPFSISSSIRV